MGNATLITISKKTGFSISTVSRVLNGQANKHRISEKTIKIITDEANSCNYSPSLLAKGLRTSKTNTIGLLIPNIENPYFANMASTVIREAKICNYTIIVIDTMEDEQNEKDGLRSLLSRKVDGVVVVPCGQSPEYLEDINKNSTPIVLIDRYFNQTELSYVCTNNFDGAYKATQYLIHNGHKNILCIQGPPHSMPVQERIRGYKKALSDNNIAENCCISGKDFSIQNGYLETKLALSSPNPPTAIFTQSNTILLGTIKAITESKLRIYEDISLVSFDENKFLDFLDPAISRISQPVKEIGILSIKILIQNIENKEREKIQIQLPPQLVLRNSVKNIM